MELSANVFDIWVFRQTSCGIKYLLLHTSQTKADRHFNGGRFWQIPSGFVEDDEELAGAIERRLNGFGLRASSVWAAEHAYIIYNRRFNSMQIIGVYAAEVDQEFVRLDPDEHSEAGWYSFDECLNKIHFRGLKNGLCSVRDYVTGVAEPARELLLK